jgi:hypothetical protein
MKSSTATISSCTRALFATAVLAVACQSAGPTFSGFATVPPGRAQLYVYRPSDAIETTTDVIFTLDGKDLAHVRNGGYATTSLAPGVYTLSVGPDGLNASPTLERRIELAPGQSLVCGYASEGNPGSVTWQLVCADANQAPADLATCTLEPLTP